MRMTREGGTTGSAGPDLRRCRRGRQLKIGKGRGRACRVDHLVGGASRDDHVRDMPRLLLRAAAAPAAARDQARFPQVACDQLHRLRPLPQQERHEIGEMAQRQHRELDRKSAAISEL